MILSGVTPNLLTAKHHFRSTIGQSASGRVNDVKRHSFFSRVLTMRFNHLLTVTAGGILMLALAACAPSPVTVTPVLATPENTAAINTPDRATQERIAVTDTPDLATQESTTPTAGIVAPDMVREDSQGAVTVTVTPLNLDDPGDTLNFDVVMNTHSVDLSMDLATLTTLETDTGISVLPVIWDAPRGGHHVGGTLSFPASGSGKPLLDGAATLTLTIRDVDVSERVFVWELTQ